jgi:hypothetical protein
VVDVASREHIPDHAICILERCEITHISQSFPSNYTTGVEAHGGSSAVGPI